MDGGLVGEIWAISSKGSDLQEISGGWADSKACALSQAANGERDSCSPDASETTTGVAGRKKS